MDLAKKIKLPPGSLRSIRFAEPVIQDLERHRAFGSLADSPIDDP